MTPSGIEPTTCRFVTYCLNHYATALPRLVLETFQIFSGVRLRLKRDGTRAETRFRLSTKRTSPFKSAGASVQSTAGSRGVRISGSNAGYTIFRGSVKRTGKLTAFASFPFISPPVRHRVPSHFNWTVLTDDVGSNAVWGFKIPWPFCLLGLVCLRLASEPGPVLVTLSADISGFCGKADQLDAVVTLPAGAGYTGTVGATREACLLYPQPTRHVANL